VYWIKLDTGGKVYGKGITAITAVKQEVRMRDWAEQIEAQQASDDRFEDLGFLQR
jgi:hypothetical protein